MIIRATVLLGALATNTASAWQQWQPSLNNGYSQYNKPRQPPSFMYLDNYDPNRHENTASSSVHSQSYENSAINPRASHTRIGRGRNRAERLAAKTSKNLSFHNYPSHIAETKRSQEERRPRKRSSLAPRSNYSSAILPRKRNKPKESIFFTPEEEAGIAYAIQAYATTMRVKDDLSNWMSKEKSTRISGLKKVPSEEHWATACGLSVSELHNVIERGQEAKARLVNGNVGLVTSIATKYYNILTQKVGVSGGTLKLDDLIQEGYIGIMDAAERFDPDKGFRFSTYGTYWVRTRILRSISETARIIRLPEHVQTMMRSIEKKRREFEQLSGRSPSLPELAHEMSISLEKVTLYQHFTRNVMSLEHQINGHSAKDEKQLTLQDKLACNEMPTPDEDAMSEAFRGEVHSMLDHLGENERWVLTHRFGLEDGYPRTLREISEEMSVSIDIVKTIQSKALKKLRQPGMMDRLKDFVDGANEEEWESSGNNHYNHDHEEFNNMGHVPPVDGYDYTCQQSMLDHMSHHMYNNDIQINGDDLDEYERPTPESIWSF